MNTSKILVVGGYGFVGRVISAELASHFPGQVIAAGRNMRRAEELSRETDGKVLPLPLDILGPEAGWVAALEGVSLVIMCIDQADTRFVERVIRAGIDYVDLTASSRFLKAMENLDETAKHSGSTVVMSVGLAPGLTNLLAASAKAPFDQVQQLDIFVMLGLGDAHGEAAMQWTLDNFNTDFNVLENGAVKTVRSFEEGERTNILGIGTRTAYRFNFPEQHSLPKTLGLPAVSSWLCFDLKIAAPVLAAIKKTGLLRVLNTKRVQNVLIQGFKNLRFGSDQFALKVEAVGRNNGETLTFSSTVRGAGEARFTGRVAAQVARRVFWEAFPAGVFHIEQIFELQEFTDSISGLEFTQAYE